MKKPSNSHYGPVTPRRVRAPGLHPPQNRPLVGRVPSPGVPTSSTMRIAGRNLGHLVPLVRHARGCWLALEVQYRVRAGVEAPGFRRPPVMQYLLFRRQQIRVAGEQPTAIRLLAEQAEVQPCTDCLLVVVHIIS
jgi:hypothetical protein